MSNIFAIASTTYREASRLPIFWLLLLVFGALVLISGEVTLFSLGEEATMIRELGLSSVNLCCFFLILLVATRAFYSEIENQTLVTLLAKPVGRGMVLLGKYLGLLRAIAGAAILLSLLLVLILWIYDGYPAVRKAETKENASHRRAWIKLTRQLTKEGAAPPTVLAAGNEQIPAVSTGLTPYLGHTRQQFAPSVLALAQGLYLILLQCLVLAAISCTLAMRFGFVLNSLTSFVIFALGNLSPYLRDSLAGEDSGPVVWFLGEALYRVLPNLETYNLTAIVAHSDGAIPQAYLEAATLTAVLYSSAVLLIGLVVFESTEAAGMKQSD